MTFLDDMLIRMNCYTGMYLTSVISDVENAIENTSENTELNNKVDMLFGSGINVGTRIGVYLAVIAVILFGIGMLFANSQKRQEKKEEVLPKIIGIVCIIFPLAILGIFELMARAVFSK